MGSRKQLEHLYAGQEDPWDYAHDAYELGKYTTSLSILPRERYETGLEIGCSEGVFTQMASSRVDRLVGVDIAETAIDRARARCADLPSAQFRQFDFIRDDLDDCFDVIFCSEVLYYVPPWRRTEVARKIASWLKPGGHLVLVHTCRKYTRTWNDIYGEGGADRLHRLFTHVLGLPVICEQVNDRYEIKIVRAAPPIYPAWQRFLEAGRLSATATFPTLRMIIRNRLLDDRRVKRMVTKVLSLWRSSPDRERSDG
jgi:SAM-dependent methyltransferase